MLSGRGIHKQSDWGHESAFFPVQSRPTQNQRLVSDSWLRNLFWAPSWWVNPQNGEKKKLHVLVPSSFGCINQCSIAQGPFLIVSQSTGGMTVSWHVFTCPYYLWAGTSNTRTCICTSKLLRIFNDYGQFLKKRF